MVGGLGGDETTGLGDGSRCTFLAGGETERLCALIDALLPGEGDGDFLSRSLFSGDLFLGEGERRECRGGDLARGDRLLTGRTGDGERLRGKRCLGEGDGVRRLRGDRDRRRGENGDRRRGGDRNLPPKPPEFHRLPPGEGRHPPRLGGDRYLNLGLLDLLLIGLLLRNERLRLRLRRGDIERRFRGEAERERDLETDLDLDLDFETDFDLDRDREREPDLEPDFERDPDFDERALLSEPLFSSDFLDLYCRFLSGEVLVVSFCLGLITFSAESGLNFNAGDGEREEGGELFFCLGEGVRE